MSNIRVIVRPRPLDETKKEKAAHGLEFHGRRVILGSKSYDPDVVMPVTSTNSDVFELCTPILNAVREGSNGTIMVYGQTGTGKTHTMLGHDERELGLAMSCLSSLFDTVRSWTLEGRRVALALSVLEVYQERVTDMLSDDRAEIQLFNGQPRACRSEPVLNLGESRTLISRCLASRHLNATALNDRSSRSHVIIILNLQEEQDSGACTSSSLYLVDLAGSESIKKSLATGRAAAEAGKINTSLLALKNVILALSSVETPSSATAVMPTRTHVPYRDSKLTELLQDSLGGSARTVFIACISLLGRDQDETKSTLDYAARARTIRNNGNTERHRMSFRLRSVEAELQKAKNLILGKIEQKGGIWVSKEDYEEFLNARDGLVESTRLMEELVQERDAAIARQNVAVSQIQVFRDTVRKQEISLQAARDAQVAAVSTLKAGCSQLQEHTTQALAAALEESLVMMKSFGAASAAAVTLIEAGGSDPALAQRLQSAWVAATEAHERTAQLTILVSAELVGCVQRLSAAARRETAAIEADIIRMIANRFLEGAGAFAAEAGKVTAHAEAEAARCRHANEATAASCANAKAFQTFLAATAPVFPQVSTAVKTVLAVPSGDEMARLTDVGRAGFATKAGGVVSSVSKLLDKDPRDLAWIATPCPSISPASASPASASPTSTSPTTMLVTSVSPTASDSSRAVFADPVPVSA